MDVGPAKPRQPVFPISPYAWPFPTGIGETSSLLLSSSSLVKWKVLENELYRPSNGLLCCHEPKSHRTSVKPSQNAYQAWEQPDLKSSAPSPWIMEMNLKQTVHEAEESRHSLCTEKPKAKPKERQVPQDSEQSSCLWACRVTSCHSDEICPGIVAWNHSGRSPFPSFTGSWMGPSTNILITMPKIILALVIYLLHTTNGADGGRMAGPEVKTRSGVGGGNKAE